MLENVNRVMALVGNTKEAYAFIEDGTSDSEKIIYTLNRIVWNKEDEWYETITSGKAYYDWNGTVTVDMGDRYVWSENRPVWFAFLTYAAEDEYDTRKQVESENLPVLIGDTESELYMKTLEYDVLARDYGKMVDMNANLADEKHALLAEHLELKKRIERFKRGEITIAEL